MSKRRIDNLDMSAAADEGGEISEPSGGAGEAADIGRSGDDAHLEHQALPPLSAAVSAEGNLPSPPVLLVDVNYPDPTLVSVILRDVARWSGMSFVLEPRANVKVQIIAPRKQPPHIAYGLVMAALAVVRLRAVHEGGAVKIVSEWTSVSA